MSATISVTEEDVYIALREWMLLAVPHDVEIIKAQDNRVAPPTTDNFITMNFMNRKRLSTGIVTYTDAVSEGSENILGRTQIDIQVDVFGAQSGDIVQTISILALNTHSLDSFAQVPIAASIIDVNDARQMAWITPENQYADRWSLDISVQANITISVDQDFADQLHATPFLADRG